MPRRPRHRALAWIAAPPAIALVTVAGGAAEANAATIGFFFLAVVLALAAWGGWAVGAAASVAAMLCFNYFFLPPVGTFHVAEPANWVALVAFLGASTLASRLVATARRQANEAQRRRRETEILYELSFGLFAVSQRTGVLGEAAARTLRAIGADSGVLLLEGSDAAASVIGTAPPEPDSTALAAARASRHIVERGTVTYLPLEVGGTLNGVLVTSEAQAPRTVLEPAGRLLGLAIERERLLAESAHLEAMRESDQLKTALLRAVSHDLRTPLTAIGLEIESLERQVVDLPAARESLSGLELELERLTRRIDNLLSLARVEAGVARPRPEPTPPGALFRAARESLALILARRPVEVRVEPGCPDAWTDPSLAVEILVNLLENAAHAAPSDRPIELGAAASPEGVRIEVLDRGPGLPRRGDSASGGLGLRIAQGFATANGGALTLLDRPGGGTIARLTLPAAPEPAEA